MRRKARPEAEGDEPGREGSRRARRARKTRELQPTDPDAYEGKEMHFLDHLEELRVRILRSMVYVAIASLVCVGMAQEEIIAFVMEPAAKALGEDPMGNSNMIFTEMMAPLMTWLKIGLLAGLVISLPFVMLEAWGFIAPALTRRERRVGYLAVLACPGLFVLGAAFVYTIFPTALAFLMQFKNYFPGAQFLLDPAKYLNMMLTLMTGMGLVFQMPVVVAALVRIGLLSSGFLVRVWRHAMVVLLVIAALITPTWDPVNLSITVGPMVALYFLSIAIALVIERGNRKREAAERDEYRLFDAPLAPAEPEPTPPAPAALGEGDPEGDGTLLPPRSVPLTAEPPVILGPPRGGGIAPPAEREESADDETAPSADPEGPAEPPD